MSLTNKYHILIIPGSWPNKQNPLSGIFLKDFVDTLEQHSKNFYYSVLYMGDSEYGVSFSQPFNFLKIFLRRFFNQKSIISKKVTFYIKPILYIFKFGRKYYERQKLKKTLRILINVQKKNGPINLIHAHFSHSAGSLAKSISEYLKVPYIITEHAGPFPIDQSLIKHGKLSSEYFNILNGANSIVAVSNSLQKKMESFGLKNITYIPNPINEKKFYISKKNDDQFNFLTISSLTHMKGIDILLKGFALMIKNHPQKKIFLQIVGTGSDHHTYIKLSKELCIEHCIFFHGSILPEHITEFYQKSHCLIHASRHESFSLVCAEAQASGLPVIATKCGGPESILMSSLLGILVENENFKLLAEAMCYLYRNYHTYNSNMIRKHFMENFSRKVVSHKIINLYKKNAKY